MKIKNCLKLVLCCLSFAIAVMAPLSALSATTADECVRSEPAPVFDAKQPGIRSHRFVRLNSHEAREYVVLASGELVDVHLGGCEYFVTTFLFHSAHILEADRSHLNAYNAAATVLRRLQQLKDKSGFDLALAAGTLEAAARKNPAIDFEEQLAVDGDGADFLQAQVQVDAAGKKAGVGFVQVSLFRGPL